MVELPLISEPPFFRPIERHEYALIIDPDAPPIAPDTFDIGPGWTLSFFSLATTDGRLATWGWTKGEFAIDERELIFDDIEKQVACAVLSYLPIGVRVAIFEHAEDATLAAAILAQQLDWTDKSPESLRRQGRRALDALGAHFDRRADLRPANVWRARFDCEIARAHG